MDLSQDHNKTIEPYDGEKRHKRNEIRREKEARRLKFVLALIFGASLVFFGIFFYYQYTQAVFDHYSVVKQYERSDGSQVHYLGWQGGILKYSKDGASFLDSNGNAVWNGSYEMKNPMACVCGSYAAVADIGETALYIFNGEDSGVQLEMTGAIIQVDISRQGIVAVAMENGDSSLINIYDPYNTSASLRVEIPTMVNEDGFPVDIAISEDGQKLVTGFIDVSSGVMKNKITFYNFDEVGQNDINRQTGMDSLDDTLLSKLVFLNNNTICAFTENGFRLYSMKQRQEQIADITYTQTIKSVMSSEQYVGVVLEEYSGEDKYRLLVYNLKGSKVLDRTFNFDYNHVELSAKDVIFVSDLSAMIMRLNGNKKFEKIFDENIVALLPFNNKKKYYLIGEKNISLIELGNEV